MADQARKQTDKLLSQMEKEVSNIYRRASNEISEKWDKYMKSHEGKVKSAYDDLQEALKSGDRDAIKSTREVYERTVRNVTLNDSKFRAMVNETTAKLANTNEVALSYVNDNMAKIYTLNYNEFGNQDISGYTFTLVNEQAIKNLAKEDKTLLPTKRLDIPKDKAWNTKSINAEILQGILQGENIPKIAERLTHVTDMNKNSAIRNARTMVTSAENKGRQDSFKKAESDGIIMKRMWVAAHDDRTRAWHADLDGVEVDVDEAWSNEYGEIMYPGDPSADPANVYNCRCSIRSVVKGFKWNDEEESIDENKTAEPVTSHDFSEIDYRAEKVTFKELSQWRKEFGNVTEEEYDIISGMNENGYIRTQNAYKLNKALRDGTVEQLSDENQKTIETLTNVIDKNRSTTNAVLLRRVDTTYLESVFNIKGNDTESAAKTINNNLGKVITENGFISTSYKEEKNLNSNDNVLLDIFAPSGTNMFLTRNREESEIILQRGTKFEVEGATITEDGKLKILMRITQRKRDRK